MLESIGNFASKSWASLTSAWDSGDVVSVALHVGAALFLAAVVSYGVLIVCGLIVGALERERR